MDFSNQVQPDQHSRKPVLPPPLRPGDTIGIIHPAGPIRDAAAFAAGLDILRSFGLQIRSNPPDGSGPDYLAASDEARIQELHALWADETVAAVMAARGGYGCLRIVRQVDFDFLRTQPKWLIGFSDLTVLLNGIFTRSALVTMHGPVVTSLPRLTASSLEKFQSRLGGQWREQPPATGLEILRPGRGQGHLVGGNLTTLTHAAGTPWMPSCSGNILFLEDTAEPPYALDRMLTHLSCCGLLDNLSGLILGMFDPGHDDRLEILRLNEQIWNRVLELTGHTNYPIWGNYPVGHQRLNDPLPVGMEAVMDSSSATLQFFPAHCIRTDA